MKETYLHASLSTAGLGLLLLLGIDLGGLTLDLTGTGKRTVHFTTEKTGNSGQGGEGGDADLLEVKARLKWLGEHLAGGDLIINKF